MISAIEFKLSLRSRIGDACHYSTRVCYSFFRYDWQHSRVGNQLTTVHPVRGRCAWNQREFNPSFCFLGYGLYSWLPTACGLAVLKVISLFAIKRIKFHLKTQILLSPLKARIQVITFFGYAICLLLQVSAHDNRLAVGSIVIYRFVQGWVKLRWFWRWLRKPSNCRCPVERL
jgi:hypothetical protein